MKQILLSILCLFLCVFSAFGQETLVLTKDQNNYELGKNYFSVYYDASNALSEQEVLSKTYISPDSIEPSTNGTFWTKLELIDSSGANLDWYFMFYNYTIDSIYFYAVDGDSTLIKDYYSVHKTKMSDRSVSFKNFTVDLTVPKNKKITLLLKSQNPHAYSFGYAIKEHKFYTGYAVQESLYFGLFYGAMLLIIVYHISFLWSLKDFSYLFYVLYILFQSVYMTFRDGLVMDEVFPETPWMVRPVFSVITILVAISMLLYARSFLRLNSYKYFDWIIKIYIPIRMLSFFLAPKYNAIHITLDYIPAVVAFAFSLISLYQKHKTSLLLGIGFLVLIVSHTINTLWHQYLIECTPQVFYSMYYGILMESVLLALANAHRFAQLKKDSITKLQLENQKIRSKLKIRKQKSIIIDQRDQIENFMYRAAHDIKGPLKSIDGLSRLGLMDPNDSPEYFGRIQLMTIRLQKIVDGFTEAVRNNSRNIKLEKISPAKLITDCISNQFTSHPHRKAIDIRNEVPAELKISTDYHSLYFVVQNLVENAMKYQDVHKEIQYVKITGSIVEKNFVLVVEDNGLGINEQAQQKIFSLFFRANNRNTEGVGMGLFIVKQALERVKGSIGLQSKEGLFTRFIVKIPVV